MSPTRDPAEAPLFPLYQLMDAFEAFSHGEPDVKPQHRSLYYFLLGYARKRGSVPRFAMPYEVGMHGSSIGSWSTYDAALRALTGWGFIGYTPGANRYKVPVVELTFRNPHGDELLGYWQTYCLAYPTELPAAPIRPPLELQNSNPSPVVELQNCNPSPILGLQKSSSTANPSGNSTGDIKKTFRLKTKDTAASAEEAVDFSEKSFSAGKSTAIGLTPDAAAPAASPPPASNPSDPGPTFEEFWAAYGKKEDTKKCKLRWKALSPAQRRAALAAVPAYVAAKPDRKYRKNPLTWLNGECWLDEAPNYAAQPAAAAVLPAGHDAPPLSLELEINQDFEAQQQQRLAKEAAERAQKFRAIYATPATTAVPSASILTPAS